MCIRCVSCKIMDLRAVAGVRRAASSVGGTVQAMRSVCDGQVLKAAHVAGGTHHAFYDHGEGDSDSRGRNQCLNATALEHVHSKMRVTLSRNSLALHLALAIRTGIQLVSGPNTFIFVGIVYQVSVYFLTSRSPQIWPWRNTPR